MYSDKKIRRYFKLAKNASSFSDYPKINIGAIIVYKNQIISVGYNICKSNPTQMRYNMYRNMNGRNYDVRARNNFLHAEMKCLIETKDVDIDWSKASIFVYREHCDGSKALSRPCPSCYQAIKERGIKNIYYSIDNKHYGYEKIS